MGITTFIILFLGGAGAGFVNAAAGGGSAPHASDSHDVGVGRDGCQWNESNRGRRASGHSDSDFS